MQTTLMAASNQWMTRPADQRFSSLADLHAAVQHYRDASFDVENVDLQRLQILVDNGAPVLAGATETPARFTHHSFHQLCRRIEAPANYLRELPASLAAENMNYGLQNLPRGEEEGKIGKGEQDRLLMTKNGVITMRAALSGKYTRIWCSDITSRLIRLTEERPEWQPAPAAFDGSRGLYASDEDMFAFLVDNDRRIFETGPAGGLSRGFFVSNSEVGAGSFSITTFFYEYICGNHRVWGASGIANLKIPHIGKADERAFGELQGELTRYAGASAKDDENKITLAQRFSLGSNKEEALDRVFGLRLPGLGRKVAAKAFEIAELHDEWYGDPKTAWGFTGGVTEIARDMENASDRANLEAAAGKILSLAF